MKTHTTKVFWLSTGIALGLHAVLFCGMVKLWQQSNSRHIKNYTIEIELTEKQQPRQENVNTKPRPKVATTDKQKIAPSQQLTPKPEIPQSAEYNATKNKQTAQTTTTSQQNTYALYKLLYSAINQQKHYPLSALRMKQQGKVRVSFRLFNNGNLDDVEVSHSSGYRSLDNAALLAVKRIQPFHPAADYVASAKDFQLDIIFQL